MYLQLFNCNTINYDPIKYYLKNESESEEKITIGKNIYSKSLLFEETNWNKRFLQLIVKEWLELQNVILDQNNISGCLDASRIRINQILSVLIEALQIVDDLHEQKLIVDVLFTELNKFERLIIPLNKLQPDEIIKISNINLNGTNPISEYFHTFLDIQCYLLKFYCISKIAKTTLEVKIQSLMDDLIHLSKNNYKRHNNDLFPCNCVKTIWILLQFITEQQLEADFWNIFNKLFQNEDAQFSLLFLKEIASLQTLDYDLTEQGSSSKRIKSNFPLLESKLKLLLQDSSSSQLLVDFKLISPLINKLWMKFARLEPLQIIWDFFSKRLNVTNRNFGQSLNILEIDEIIDTILWSGNDCKEDFEFFVSMLLEVLREFPAFWSKMKGRIFSQLGPNKVKDLSDIGILHVSVLFIALASIYFEEINKKMLGLLESYSTDEKKFKCFIWYIYAVYLLRLVKEGRNVENVSQLFEKLLQESVTDQKHYPLIKSFFLNLDVIINASVDLNLGQHLLFNTWLHKYLSHCYSKDLATALLTLNKLIDKIIESENWTNWNTVLSDIIFPSLRQLTYTKSAPEITGLLAGKICRYCSNLSTEMFNFFTSDHVPISTAEAFLNIVLDRKNRFILSEAQEMQSIRLWTKISLLSTDFNRDLTENVAQLDLIPQDLKMHLLVTDDGIKAVIKYFGSDIKRHEQSMNSMKLFDAIFGQLDIYIGQYFSQSDSHKEAVVLRIYTCVSLSFHFCGQLLYNRNKTTCPFTRIVSTLLLPQELIMNKKPHQFVVNSIKKTWHFFFESISSLNKFNDPYLNRVLKDLITKYMTHFPSADSPIVLCLNKEPNTSLILETINNAYFRHPVKEEDVNVLKALKIVKDFIESTSEANRFKMVLNKILYGLFEVVIFSHTQRNMAISVITTIIAKSRLYEDTKDEFHKCFIAVTEKHMGFNTIYYFMLANALAKLIPNDMKNWLSEIKEQVVQVERKRGVGFDVSLRGQFDKLNNIIKGN